jgi:dTDP-glucose 4,6-dehydratase
MVAESWRHPEDWFQTNVVATVKFHDQLRRCDFLQRYVHVSTPEVYGSCEGSVTESAPLNPTTPYAVSRAACDMSLLTFAKAYQFPVVFTRAGECVSARPATVPHHSANQSLHSNGPQNSAAWRRRTSVRSFIHIRDVAEGTWRIALEGSNGHVYHLSTPQLISIRDLVAKICSRLGVAFEDCVDIVGERLGKDGVHP